MKKLRPWELIALTAALALALFTAGFLAGRRSVPVSIRLERLEPADRAGESLPPEAEKDGLVNLNTADAAALTALPGIGPALAERIVAYREAHGPFASVSELRRVSGIGSAALARLRDLVTVE